jgi:hypothetical protein
MIRVKLPNGGYAQFPDNMPHDQIASVIQRQFPVNNNQNSSNVLHNAANWAEENITQPVEQNIVRPANSFAQGAMQGIGNILPGIANLGVSGINALGGNISKAPTFDFAPHDPNAQIGELLSFLGGGGAVKALGKIPEISNASNALMKIPEIANVMKNIMGTINKNPTMASTAGNAIIGGAYSPDNPLLGMALGGGAGALGAGMGKLSDMTKQPLEQGLKPIQENISSAKNALTNPSGQAKEIEHHLSQGSNNVDHNSKLLAEDLRKAYNMRNEESGIFFNFVKDQVGNKKIYKEKFDEHHFPLGLDKSAQQLMTKIKDLNIGDLYKNFKNNPTFNNSHNLQSELGVMERDLKSIPHKTPDENNSLSAITSARKQLNNDIEEFLKEHDKVSNITLSDRYKKGIDLYRENVAPYLSSKKLREVIKGDKTNIKNIHSIFDTPSNIINKSGKEEIGSINKIMQDLPQTSKNRILFDAIGGNKSSPQALIDSLNKIKSKGFGNYFTPELEENMKILNNKIKNRELAKTGAKVAGAGTAVALTGNALNHLF